MLNKETFDSSVTCGANSQVSVITNNFVVVKCVCVAKSSTKLIDSLNLTLDCQRNLASAAQFVMNLSEDCDCVVDAYDSIGRKVVIDVSDQTGPLSTIRSGLNRFRARKGLLKFLIYCVDNNSQDYA